MTKMLMTGGRRILHLDLRTWSRIVAVYYIVTSGMYLKREVDWLQCLQQDQDCHYAYYDLHPGLELLPTNATSPDPDPNTITPPHPQGYQDAQNVSCFFPDLEMEPFPESEPDLDPDPEMILLTQEIQTTSTPTATTTTTTTLASSSLPGLDTEAPPKNSSKPSVPFLTVNSVKSSNSNSNLTDDKAVIDWKINQTAPDPVQDHLDVEPEPGPIMKAIRAESERPQILNKAAAAESSKARESSRYEKDGDGNGSGEEKEMYVAAVYFDLSIYLIQAAVAVLLFYGAQNGRSSLLLVWLLFNGTMLLLFIFVFVYIMLTTMPGTSFLLLTLRLSLEIFAFWIVAFHRRELLLLGTVIIIKQHALPPSAPMPDKSRREMDTWP